MGEADHFAPEVEARLEMVARVPGAAADARVDGPGGRLPWDLLTRDVFLLPQFAPWFPLCVTPHTLQQRRRRRIHHQKHSRERQATAKMIALLASSLMCPTLYQLWPS